MTRRNRFHSRTMARVTRFLDSWLDEQPEPRGQVLVGDAGVILGHDPDTTVGIDVTYISAEVMLRQTENSTLIDGVPTLVVEILSPSDTIEDINEKIDAHLAARVSIIWIIDPIGTPSQCTSPNASPSCSTSATSYPPSRISPGSECPLLDCSSEGSSFSRQCSMTLSPCVRPASGKSPIPLLRMRPGVRHRNRKARSRGFNSPKGDCPNLAVGRRSRGFVYVVGGRIKSMRNRLKSSRGEALGTVKK